MHTPWEALLLLGAVARLLLPELFRTTALITSMARLAACRTPRLLATGAIVSGQRERGSATMQGRKRGRRGPTISLVRLLLRLATALWRLRTVVAAVGGSVVLRCRRRHRLGGRYFLGPGVVVGDHVVRHGGGGGQVADGAHEVRLDANAVMAAASQQAHQVVMHLLPLLLLLDQHGERRLQEATTERLCIRPPSVTLQAWPGRQLTDDSTCPSLYSPAAGNSWGIAVCRRTCSSRGGSSGRQRRQRQPQCGR